MQNVRHKVILSILTITFVIITSFATTFAWVGILTASSIEQFTLSIKEDNKESDYSLLISSFDSEYNQNGEANYKKEVDITDLKKQILDNLGEVNTSYLTSVEAINKAYSSIELEPISIDNKSDLLNNNFYLVSKDNLNKQSCNKLLQFDLYLSVEYIGDKEIDSNTNMYTSLYLSEIENTLIGTLNTTTISNDYTYPSNNIYNILFDHFKKNESGNIEISSKDSLTVDSKDASRIAFTIYNPINMNESYTKSSSIYKQVIYQGGNASPTYNIDTNTYSFGGILPEEYNLAFKEYKKIYNLSDKFSIPSSTLKRGLQGDLSDDEWTPDLELVNDNSLLADTSIGFGIVNGISNKIKITVQFWFEGWDSDCFAIINDQKVTINLTLSTAIDTK